MPKPEKKRRRSLIDAFFGDSLFEEMESLFEDLPEAEFTGGYSISVVQTPEGTRVKAKVGKDTDVQALRKQLEKQYPGAKIEIEGGRQEPLIREISTKPVQEEK
ncbi:MAG: hypothetical protein RMJ15_09010 [Nitrososphaerota archaeon]|nr:hypothetical protein [Candidatus Bathyarchaeota archaeon]MDW8023855.1 hypothetical protein [Nitrososphaerota archaeon]